MKRFLGALFSVIILIGMFSTVIAESGQGIEVLVDGQVKKLSTVKIKINDKLVDGKDIDSDIPFVSYNERTLVPLRAVSEHLKTDTKVDWKNGTQEAIVESSDKTIVFKIDSSEVIVNGEIKTIDVQAKLMKSKTSASARTMVPLRFIFEELGYEVDWDDKDGVATIEKKKEEPQVKPEEDIKINSIQAIKKETINGREAVVIYNTYCPDIKDFSLTSPDRLVVDMRNTNLNNAVASINTDIVKDVRLSQYANKDQMYSIDEKVTRVVLDISDDYSNAKLEKVVDGNKLILYVDGVKKPVETKPTPEPTPVPTPSEPEKPNNGSKQKVVVLDPGHGGSDGGAAPLGVKEKDLTLKVGLKTKEKLEALGYKVIMTRSTDTRFSENTSTDLKQRADVANNNNADAFVSIHFNSATAPSATGIETYHHTNKSKDKALAQAIQNELIKSLGVVNRGVKTANHAVTRQTNTYAVLTELGFISNPNDLNRINTDEYLEKCAISIANGIHSFLSR